MSAPRRLLVTSALPYANGPIHLGHLVEYIQTDIWVRFQRLRGHECRYMCADDTHGTAIMMRAQAEGISEETWIEAVNREHQRDFAAFDISFDYYGSTHSDQNRQLCAAIWQSLRARGLVTERDVSQLFDAERGLFLADRYVQGTCPKCGAEGQHGDACGNCGATYSPTDLINPRSTLSGAIPETRSAKHWFVQVEQAHDFLNEWTQSGDHLQPGVANYLKGHFLSEPLRDWDVSRPAPYFGFEIPDSPGNYWYVWFDAPIGYIAATQAWCEAQGANLDTYWRSQDTEIHHFIGKDIVYFHSLFWPVVLQAAGYQLPTRVQVHGMLTTKGEKMSKSKGTPVKASTYLEHLESSTLRYYYATKLSNRVEDLDLDAADFVAKVNGDLVGKVANLASRSARFVEDLGLSARYPASDELFALAAAQGDVIAGAYEACDYGKAMRMIMALADRANEYVDQQQPWALRKDPSRAKDLQDVCTVALNLFRQLVVYLAPVLPSLAAQVGELFGEKLDAWSLSQSPVVGRQLAPFKHLARRVEARQFEAMLQASTQAPTSKGDEPAPVAKRSVHPTDTVAVVSECTLDEFQKVDLRVAEIVEAEEVPEARKLLKLTIDLGPAGRKTVFAGIKGAYTPEQLRGRLVVVLANLKPRSMKFGVSEGMVLAASDSAEDSSKGAAGLFLLSPDSGARPGFQIS